VTTPAIPDTSSIPLIPRGTSPALAKGGETEGRRRFDALRRQCLAGHPGRHDDLTAPRPPGLPPAQVHPPWRLDAAARRRLGYPDPSSSFYT
jgi:hypothetical protein